MMESGLGKSEKTNGAGEERWRREMKEKRAREEDKGWKEGGGEGRDEGGGCNVERRRGVVKFC